MKLMPAQFCCAGNGYVYQFDLDVSFFFIIISSNKRIFITTPFLFLYQDAERQSYTDRSKAIIEEYVVAHPDSEFVKNYVANKAKKPSTTSSTADAADSPAPKEPAQLKNKMLEGLKPTATSTPKRAPPKSKGEEEEESEDEESEDESGSDSSDE